MTGGTAVSAECAARISSSDAAATASLTSRTMKLRILIWLVLGIGAVFIDGVAGAQPAAPAPRAVLGVMLRELTAEDVQALGTKGMQGAFVQSVVPNGPAERAGVRAGDIIVGANRQAVASGAQLVQMIGARSPGDVVELVVLRAGRRQTITVALAPPLGAPAQRTPPAPTARRRQSGTRPNQRISPVTPRWSRNTGAPDRRPDTASRHPRGRGQW